MFFGIFVTAWNLQRWWYRTLWIGQNLCSLVYLLQPILWTSISASSCELVKIYVLWYICYSEVPILCVLLVVVNWSKFMFFGIFVTAKAVFCWASGMLWIGQNLCSLVYLLQLVGWVNHLKVSCELVKIYVLWYICYSKEGYSRFSCRVVNWSKFMFFGIFVTA